MKRKWMKENLRKLAICIALVAAVSIGTGCGGKEKENNSDTEKYGDDGELIEGNTANGGSVSIPFAYVEDPVSQEEEYELYKKNEKICNNLSPLARFYGSAGERVSGGFMVVHKCELDLGDYPFSDELSVEGIRQTTIKWAGLPEDTPSYLTDILRNSDGSFSLFIRLPNMRLTLQHVNIKSCAENLSEYPNTIFKDGRCVREPSSDDLIDNDEDVISDMNSTGDFHEKNRQKCGLMPNSNYTIDSDGKGTCDTTLPEQINSENIGSEVFNRVNCKSTTLTHVPYLRKITYGAADGYYKANFYYVLDGVRVVVHAKKTRVCVQSESRLEGNPDFESNISLNPESSGFGECGGDSDGLSMYEAYKVKQQFLAEALGQCKGNEY